METKMETKKRTSEEIAVQAEKIAHLPDVKCECSDCINNNQPPNNQLLPQLSPQLQQQIDTHFTNM